MNGQVSGTDWIGLIMTSNEAALKWAQVFTGRALPEDEAIVVNSDGRSSVNINGLLLIGAVVIVAVLLLRK